MIRSQTGLRASPARRGDPSRLQGRTELTYSFNEMDQFINGNNCTTPFARGAIRGRINAPARGVYVEPDARCFAARSDLENKPLAMTDFTTFSCAFRKLSPSCAVSLHPVMGRYLSHVGNQGAPQLNQYPTKTAPAKSCSCSASALGAESGRDAQTRRLRPA
jgi:hypothetical protein